MQRGQQPTADIVLARKYNPPHRILALQQRLHAVNRDVPQFVEAPHRTELQDVSPLVEGELLGLIRRGSVATDQSRVSPCLVVVEIILTV